MELTFIGSGGAFTVGDNFQSNMLLQADPNNRLLIDCGSDARHALYRLGFTYRDIEHVYISHLHADHVGGLEWLGFARFFDPDCDQPRIYISEDLLPTLWDECLAAGMHSIEEYEASLATYFDVQTITTDHNQFTWANTQFELIATEHVYNDHKWVPCYGLSFTVNNKRIFITTDSRYTPDKFKQIYQQADIIFHDCETAQLPSGVHAHFSELCQLPKDIKAKMWLYHYQAGDLPDAVAQGFCGYAKPGQPFKLCT